MFLAFHPSQVQDASRTGAKLPLTIYESVYEGENATENSKAMQVDGEEQLLSIRFRELPFSVETGEAEMIGIDTIARSARTAAALQSSGPSLVQQEAQTSQKAEAGQAEPSPDTVVLSHEEEERKSSCVHYQELITNSALAVIASLNTRLNAIRTLESRISLIKSYLASVSHSPEDQPTETTKPPLSHPILRNINALLSHLSLLTPEPGSAFAAESFAQRNDVLLVSLLGQLGNSIKGMRELGRKTAIMNNIRQSNSSRKTQLAMQSRLEDEFLSRDGLSLK